MNKKNQIRLFMIFALVTLWYIESFTIHANPESTSIATSTTQEETIPCTNTNKPMLRPTLVNNNVGIKRISLNRKSIKLNKGDKRVIKATYIDKKHEGVKWSSSNPNVATVNKKGVVTGIKKGTAIIKCQSRSGKVKATCKITVAKVKYIAFTFDDGPSIYTDKLLDALKKNNSYATFFVLGDRAKKYKPELKRIYSEGHQVGSHAYDHKQLTKLSKKDIKLQISKTNENIKSVIKVGPTLFRPPYGSYDSTVKKYSNLPIILWSVDTLDWKYKKVNYVYKEILKTAKDGEIILLHDIHKTSVNGFIKALPKLKEKNYELVTVSEMFEIKNKSLKDEKVYFSAK